MPLPPSSPAALSARPAPPPAEPLPAHVLASPPAEPLPAHVLADIVGGIAAAPPLWRALVRHDPDGRRPVRVIATERYEVWVIGWTTGQNVRLHDHGASAGAFLVTEGELTELLPDRWPAAGGVVERTLGTGRLRHLAVGTVHDVTNRAAAPATSIHAYSPPLTAMTYYDAELRPAETEPVAPEEPVLWPAAGSYLLHPAGRRVRR
jgi:predicted metal-dependent enzyme (double-stranded beta helix superfamily)